MTVDVDTLLPILRRVVGARVANNADAEDLVQEALARVLQHQDRIEDGMVEPYAISTARNLVATMWRNDARQRGNRHRLHAPSEAGTPEEQLLAGEAQTRGRQPDPTSLDVFPYEQVHNMLHRSSCYVP